MDTSSKRKQSTCLVAFSILLIAAVGVICGLIVADAGHPAAGDVSLRAFFADLFKTYTPRRACMFHEPPVIWLHLVSDTLIAAAYFSIPVALVYFARQRKDLPFHWIYVLFAAFILACGTTHLLGAWNLWQALYRIDGIVKFITAVLSVATAVVLWPLIPKALSLPSHAQLEARVRQRTAELAAANETLRQEIAGRAAAEEHRERLLVSERAAREEGERANRMKDEFLAMVSHELRTPLNAMLGWSDLLAHKSLEDEDVRDGIEVIHRNAQAQAQLVEDLLDLSRIISGQMRLRMLPVDLTEVVRSAAQAVAPAAEAKGIAIRQSLPHKAAPINGDFGRLQQVVWNLLSNAVKFTPAGGNVSMTVTHKDSSITLSISDTGEGMPPEFLPHVFERFQQADSSSTRRHGGLGIGLAIVRHLVELHGGTVRASSPGLGKGSTFTVMLPIHFASQQLAAADAAAPAPAGTSLNGLRILVVEDEPDSRRLIKRLLEDDGAAVITAGSAADAWCLLESERPDLLVCDISMPGEDGYSLIQRIRAHPDPAIGKIPAAALTAYARPEDRARALDSGFQAHLPKPVQPADLLSTLAALGNTGPPPQQPLA